jgi:hypothetical protein
MLWCKKTIMKISTFFVIIDILLILWSTMILFYFSKKTKNQLLHFFKTLAYVLTVMIIGYFITIYAMFWGIIPRNSLILSITLISIINIWLYLYYSIILKHTFKYQYPILLNIIYMSIIIYWVHYFWYL